MKVSVVIPTFRRPEQLERCLDALSKQTLPGSEFEILVCDDADSGEAAGLIVKLSRQFPARLRWLAVSQAGSGRHGPAAARNAGWRHAAAPIVAFTEDDAIPDPKWLEEGLKKLADANFIAVAGRVVCPGNHGSPAFPEAEFSAANCFVRRSALQKVSGFDERFTVPAREDSDLYFTLLELAARSPGALRVGRNERAIVFHSYRLLGWPEILERQKRAFFQALLYKKHPRLYRQRIQAIPPLRYYLQILSFATALLSAFFGMTLYLALGVLAWLVLTFHLAFKRYPVAEASPIRSLRASLVLPFVAIYWRVKGAIRFQVLFF